MQSASPAASPSPVETEVRRIRLLLEQQCFADALTAAESLLGTVPENRDVLYMVAVSQRYLAKISEALSTLDVLERHHPTFSRLYQERGHCYVAVRDAARAIDAYLTAVNRNPAMPASWSKLQVLFRMAGQTTDAEMAAGHVAALAKLPPEIVTATGLFADGDLLPAERLVRDFLLTHGNHLEGMRLLARIGLELDVLDDAELLLEAVLTAAPDYHAARFDYARTLLRRYRHVRALEELTVLLKADPQNRAWRTTYATAVVGMGEHERALGLYRELLVDAPPGADAELHLSVAHSLKTLGRQKEAITAYRAAAQVRPHFGDAYWSLANLKTYRFSDQELARMEHAEAAEATPLADRYHLCFALGKAFEDLGSFEQSYLYYARGNSLKRSETRYQPESLESNTREQKAVGTREFFAARSQVGCAAQDPIFIVGLPRSGSTLLEQILASHSQVEGTMELADVARIVQELQGRDPQRDLPGRGRYPAILADLKPEDFLRLGNKYLADTRIYRTDRRYFIDKMPNNFRHLGLIHLMLPNAKIIDARREPMACCFSNFKQLFAMGQEFTYGIDDIARYYRNYLDLMTHWETVLPGKILRIQHEDIVDDLEGQVRLLLEFCGLEFEPACIEFYKTERSVRTASSEQVRQPLFREGLDQWKNYEPWLDDLKNALGDARVRYRLPRSGATLVAR